MQPRGDIISNLQYLGLLDMNCFIIGNALNRLFRQWRCVKIPLRVSFNRMLPAPMFWTIAAVAECDDWALSVEQP